MGCGAGVAAIAPDVAGAGGAGAICLRPGCGKPTWNGGPNEYCSQTCRSSASTCLTPGCGKPTWNGQPNGYCSKKCKAGKDAADVVVTAVGDGVCQMPCCGKPTWDGSPNGFCGPAGHDGPLCKRPGCGKPTWNGRPDQYCGKSCREACAAKPADAKPGTQVSAAKFADIQNQFQSKWDAKRGACPAIKSIWHVHDPALLERHRKYCQAIGNVPCFGSGKNPGNVQRRFHCTTMKCVDSYKGTPCSASDCAVCSIIKTGFLLKFAGKCGSAWGAGIYSSPTPSYANWVLQRKCTFLCSVACGNVDMNDSKGPLPAGTHSRVASSTTGNPADNELIVFDEAAIIPKYLILF